MSDFGVWAFGFVSGAFALPFIVWGFTALAPQARAVRVLVARRGEKA